MSSNKDTPPSEPDHEQETRSEPVMHQAQSVAQSALNTVRSTAEATVETVTSNATFEELKEQLAKAQAQIAAFTSKSTDGLRQRKAGVASPAETGKAAPAGELAQAVRQSTEGVPIQIVAVLCLLSFFIGWYFY